MKQKSVTVSRLGYVQVMTRQCWNCNTVSSVYVAVVLMTFGALGVLSSPPSPPASDWGRVRPAGSELPIGAQPKVPAPATGPWGSPVEWSLCWSFGANQTTCTERLHSPSIHGIFGNIYRIEPK